MEYQSKQSYLEYDTILYILSGPVEHALHANRLIKKTGCTEIEQAEGTVFAILPRIYNVTATGTKKNYDHMTVQDDNKEGENGGRASSLFMLQYCGKAIFANW